jgi:hypothetical protein
VAPEDAMRLVIRALFLTAGVTQVVDHLQVGR